MNLIDNWKISSKILAAVLFVSAAFALSAGYSSLQLQHISSTYDKLANRDAQASQIGQTLAIRIS
ncbi:MAG TPA: hypothetical protein PLG07_14130, partial [Phenylobacterium sp.]|nr:hypothetical protein [Phenylobacterium sp.]